MLSFKKAPSGYVFWKVENAIFANQNVQHLIYFRWLPSLKCTDKFTAYK